MVREVAVNELTDFRMPIKSLQAILRKLVKEHGKDTVIYVDAGYNNVCVNVEVGVKPHPSTSNAIEAMKKLAKRTQKEGNDNIDLSMQAMYLSDAGDYLSIASMLQEGNVKKAREHARNLDTAARECIPDNVWKLFLDEEK